MTKTQQPELPAPSDDQERAEFERAFPECNFKQDRFGDYTQVRIQAAWIGWKRKAAVLADRERRDTPTLMTEDEIRAGFSASEGVWTFKGMTAWQVWYRAAIWAEHMRFKLRISAAPSKVEGSSGHSQECSGQSDDRSGHIEVKG